MANGQSMIGLACKEQREAILRANCALEIPGQGAPVGGYRLSEIPQFLPIKCPETGEVREVEMYFGGDFGRGKILTPGLITIAAYRTWKRGQPHGRGRICSYLDLQRLKEFVIEVLRYNKYLGPKNVYPSLGQAMASHEQAKNVSALPRVKPSQRRLIYSGRRKAKPVIPREVLLARFRAAGKLID